MTARVRPTTATRLQKALGLLDTARRSRFRRGVSRIDQDTYRASIAGAVLLITVALDLAEELVREP